MELILKEQDFQTSRCADSSCAVKLGKLLSVDYIILGSVDKIDSYILSIKFVSIKNGEVIFTGSETTKDETGLKEAVERLVTKSIKAVKGISVNDNSQTVTAEKSNIKYSFLGEIEFNYLFPVGDMGKLLKPGYGGILKLQCSGLLVENLIVGSELGGAYFKGKNQLYNHWMVLSFVNISISYNFNIADIFNLIPSVSGGYCYNMLNSKFLSESESFGNGLYNPRDFQTKKAFEPIVKGGIDIKRIIFNKYEIFIGARYPRIIEKSGPMDFVSFNAGIGVDI